VIGVLLFVWAVKPPKGPVLSLPKGPVLSLPKDGKILGKVGVYLNNPAKGTR